MEKPLSGRFVSAFLVSRGYEVYPQALDAHGTMYLLLIIQNLGLSLGRLGLGKFAIG
ncbi:MAG: hypothetical protein QXU46_00115 [Candidatus Bathyarchaeia archaeon]